MCRCRRRWRELIALTLLCASGVAGCRTEPAEPQPRAEVASPPRRLGAWSGTGNATLGFVSESGSFRIHWTATNKDVATPGTFELTLRSGISGRPLKVIADDRGSASGVVEFGDDPRMYEFLIESRGANWTVTVDETFAPPTSRP